MLYNLNAGFFENIGKIFSTPEYLNMLFKGLGTTLLISVGATIVGLILGTLVAVVKIIPAKNPVMKVLNVICNVYTTVFRGTPMALQLFIMAFVIFAIRGFPMEITALLAVGINSGAYVS